MTEDLKQRLINTAEDLQVNRGIIYNEIQRLERDIEKLLIAKNQRGATLELLTEYECSVREALAELDNIQ